MKNSGIVVCHLIGIILLFLISSIFNTCNLISREASVSQGDAKDNSLNQSNVSKVKTFSVDELRSLKCVTNNFETVTFESSEKIKWFEIINNSEIDLHNLGNHPYNFINRNSEFISTDNFYYFIHRNSEVKQFNISTLSESILELPSKGYSRSLNIVGDSMYLLVDDSIIKYEFSSNESKILIKVEDIERMVCAYGFIYFSVRDLGLFRFCPIEQSIGKVLEINVRNFSISNGLILCIANQNDLIIVNINDGKSYQTGLKGFDNKIYHSDRTLFFYLTDDFKNPIESRKNQNESFIIRFGNDSLVVLPTYEFHLPIIENKRLLSIESDVPSSLIQMIPLPDSIESKEEFLVEKVNRGNLGDCDLYPDGLYVSKNGVLISEMYICFDYMYYDALKSTSINTSELDSDEIQVLENSKPGFTLSSSKMQLVYDDKNLKVDLHKESYEYKEGFRYFLRVESRDTTLQTELPYDGWEAKLEGIYNNSVIISAFGGDGGAYSIELCYYYSLDYYGFTDMLPLEINFIRGTSDGFFYSVLRKGSHVIPIVFADQDYCYSND